MKIKFSQIKHIFLIVPFFELYSINLFIDNDIAVSLFYAIDRIMAIMRWTITGWMLFKYIYARQKVDRITQLVILMVISRLVSCYMNGTLTSNAVVGNLTYIGFALLIESLIGEDIFRFLRANEILFGFFSFSGLITTFLFPKGFGGNAIYFFGSKNSSFYYYFLFMFFYMLFAKYTEKTKNISSVIFTVLFCVSAIITNSANSLICMIAILVYAVGKHLIEKRTRLFSPKMMLVYVSAIAWFILYGKNTVMVNNILDTVSLNNVLAGFGKDITFTGRDYIWNSAFTYLQSSLVWGIGDTLNIMLPSGSVANHAHNFFVDTLVKYGVINFIILMLLIFQAFVCIKNKSDKKIIVMFSFFMLVMLLHSLFDDIMIYMIILVFIVFDKYTDNQVVACIGIKENVKNGFN